MITSHDRIGLVGANGTGKSTLMKIFAGIETLDYGFFSTAKGISAGYLPQDGLALSGRTVFRRVHGGFFRAARNGTGDGRPDRAHAGARSVFS